ncbi:AraC family transcriptional regulator [Agromyces atrinae]|uniref:AraC family transcriptional regulator n=2 Tax=Agromyces atrinae TaxID=592376 RepID=A0A4Q2MAY2_9MICO|nr:AraC family transcriptional regulator [Agromyces atrinae]NYD66484.1 AraC-like DNA-binding protein [Agromyces atrinae]RXZ87162.1 AraC family transcriptional regulator [Agromyces atrinae]
MAGFTDDDVIAWFDRLVGAVPSAGARRVEAPTSVMSFDGAAGLAQFARGMDVVSPDAAEFSARLALVPLVHVAMSARLQTPLTTSRTERWIAEESEGAIIFGAQNRGGVICRQGENAAVIAPGRSTLLLTDVPFVMEHPGVTEPVGLQVPLELLGVARDELVAVAALPLPDSPLTRATRTFVNHFVHEAVVDGTAGDVADVELAVLDLVRATVAQAVGRARRLEDRTLYVRSTVRDLIERRHRSPEFSVDSIARALHLSRRQLYRYFSPDEDGLADLIAERRIESARRLLLDHPHAPIGEVAASTGFANANTFRSQFVRRFGVTPTEYRREPNVAERSA